MTSSDGLSSWPPSTASVPGDQRDRIDPPWHGEESHALESQEVRSLLGEDESSDGKAPEVIRSLSALV